MNPTAERLADMNGFRAAVSVPPGTATTWQIDNGLNGAGTPAEFAMSSLNILLTKDGSDLSLSWRSARRIHAHGCNG